LFKTPAHTLLFPEKAKSVSSASQKIMVYLILREAEPQDLRKPTHTLLFLEKEAKSVSSASQKNVAYLILREAELRGLGLAPEKPILFFCKKALVLLRRGKWSI
jgi:hypothetical protein